MRPSRARTHHESMDVVAIVIGIVVFALLLGAVAAIDRI
jgi:hypothetical protein